MIKAVTKQDIKTGYKKTPIGIIPEDWEAKKIGEFTTKVGSGSTPRGGSKVYLKDGVPFIRSQNVFDNKLDISDNVCIDEKTHKKMRSTHVYSGDVLLNISGASIGRTCVVPNYIKTANVNQHVCIIRLTGNLNNLFLQSYLSSFHGQKFILRNQTGGNREGLNHESVRNLKIPIPPLPEQKRIAHCLSTWDLGIEKLTRLIETKKLQKKGLMQQLLTDKKRLEGFDDEWKEVKIKDISKKKSSNLQANSLEEKSGSYPVYGATGFLTKIDFYEEEEPYIGIVKDGSGVGNMYFLQGKSSVLGTLDKILQKKANLYFLFAILKGLNFEKYKVGGAIPHIYYKDYSNEKVLVPCLQEQTAIAEILQTADQEIELLEQKLSAMQEQKKGLMQVLLRGERRLVS